MQPARSGAPSAATTARSGPSRSRIGASMLRLVAGVGGNTPNAAGKPAGKPKTTRRSASRPPAEAAMATTRGGAPPRRAGRTSRTGSPSTEYVLYAPCGAASCPGRRGTVTARAPREAPRGQRRRAPALALQPGQGPVPARRVHQGPRHRLLHPDRPGAAAAPRGPAADAQTLSERRRGRSLLREALPAAPARLGAHRRRLVGP